MSPGPLHKFRTASDECAGPGNEARVDHIIAHLTSQVRRAKMTPWDQSLLHSKMPMKMHVRCYSIRSINGLKTSTKVEEQCISKYDVILTYTASTQRQERNVSNTQNGPVVAAHKAIK